MATYLYKAKKSNAETVEGQVSAQTRDEAIDLISQLGLLPVSVEAQDKSDINLSGRPQSVRVKDRYVFTKQLADLIKSGIPILRALHIIADQTQNKYFKKVILRVAWDVKNGRALSESLTEYPVIFSPLYVTMVHAGEESGQLQEMLVNIAAYQIRQHEIISKVRTALVYPVFMGVVGLGTIIFIVTFVLPKMKNLFINMGDALPLPTVMLLSFSHFFEEFWLFILIGILGVAGIISRWIQSEHGKKFFSRFLLNLPYVGSIILHVELARFCRTFVLLLQNGVSVVKALDITIPILSNEVIKGHLGRCRDDLTSGKSFGESLQQSSDIPVMMGHLISVAEESGKLDEALADIAQGYEQETDEHIKIMTTLFEPLMILAVGLIIGFMVFAMLLPIFQVDVLAG